METRTITVCQAVYIGVNCEANDPIDVKCGGPEYLGYDFYISIEENLSIVERNIKQYLIDNKKPFVSIVHNLIEDFNVEDLWSLEKIEKCIHEESY